MYRIDPLQGAENYAVWKIKMMDILTDQGYMDIVDGSEILPTVEAEAKLWRKKDQAALSIIRLRVADKMIVYIASATTSKGAWDTIQQMLEPQGALSTVLVRRKLFRAACEEGTAIDDHIRMLITYREELIGLGQTLDDAEFAITLLTSLPESWNNFIAGIDTTSLKDSSKLIARILEQYRRIKSANDDTALVAKNSGKFGNKRNPNIKCFKCGKKGHISTECRSKEKKDSSDGKDNKSKSGQRSTDRSNEAVDEWSFSAVEEDEIALQAIKANKEAWLLDSGTTSHITHDKSWLENYNSLSGHSIKGVGGRIDAIGKGNIKLVSYVGDKIYPIILKDVLYAPDSPDNLISTTRLTAAGGSMLQKGNFTKVKSPDGIIKILGIKTEGLANLYVARVKILDRNSSDKQDQSYVTRSVKSWDEWHRILGHLNMESVKRLHDKNMVIGMEVNTKSPETSQCAACIQSKQHVQPFPKISPTEIANVGDLTVTDVWGPARTTAIGGELYFISFTDGKSRHTIIYFMKKKDEAFAKFKLYKNFVETQTGHKLKKIRADGGKEYVNKQFQNFIVESGMELEITTPHSPSQNGIAERLNRTVVEHARAMIIQNDIPLFLWTEAINYANLIKNRSPTRALEKQMITPYEAFWKKKPDLSLLEEFGRPCWVLRQDGKQSILDPKSRQFLFTGINNSTKGYRYYNPVTRQIQTSRNVIFMVEDSPTTSEDVTVNHPTLFEGEGEREQAIMGDKDQNPKPVDTNQVIVTTPSKIPIRSKSSRIASQNSHPDYVKMNNPAARNKSNFAMEDLAFLGEGLNNEPLSLEEAKSRSDWPKWKQAMDEEIKQLHNLGTYTITKLPEDRKAIACKWVYRLKKDSEGNIVRYKARVVAKGFSQIPGIDFDETFAPVMRLDTLRLLLALSVSLHLKIHVVDVVGAYLNAHLKETIYMKQIPDYENGTNNVLQLLQTLYGLKQSGRAWNEKLNATFLKLGYTRLISDQCVYIRKQDQSLSIVAVHVDDMTIFASNDDVMSEIKEEFKKNFTITDLGELKQVVGFEVTRDDKGNLKIAQKQYIKKILERFGMENSKPCKMPMDPNIRLTKTPEDESHNFPEYGAAIGSLMYAAIGTRPDIAYAVQCLSQFTNNPNPEHWTAVKRVFRYLNGTQDLGIVYKRNAEINLDGYTDADWGSNPVDRKSISGYIFLIGNSPVTWSSKKQQTVALSTMEAEYMAASMATREAMWLRTLLQELGFKLESPTTLNTDNQSAIQFTKNSGFHARSKHIDIQYHFVREKIISNEVIIPYCASEDNLADMLTKALPMPRHQDLTNRSGMQSELRGSVDNIT